MALHLSGRHHGPVTVESLTAPALDATTGVKLGGQTFAPDTTTGRLGAMHTTRLGASAQGGYSATVPGDSAVLITA